MKNQINKILLFLLIIAVGFIIYQNFLSSPIGGSSNPSGTETQLYTCGMHPDIISEEEGNCPICEMKLTPIKNKKDDSGEQKIAYWVAPMDPNEIYDAPGKSKMGMDLVPVYENEISGGTIVKIDPAVQQNMNVKLLKVDEKKLSAKVNTNGVIAADERNEYLITSRTAGWIENLYINYTGQKVSKGEKLLDIYSPELTAAQKELLSSLRYLESVKKSGNKTLIKSGEELLSNSIKKLELLEMSKDDIEELQSSKKLKKYTTVYAPTAGTVLKKDVVAGTKINTGAMLMHISDLSNLWVLADLYEHEISKVKLNAKVKLYPNAMPTEVLEGKVSFIYPTVDEKTRTVKIRIDIPNYNGALKPSMLVRAEVEGVIYEKTPIIPEDAVIRSGHKSIAVLSLGEGKFKPVEVKLGHYAANNYQVLKGLQPGNLVVSSAQFLIDSESNLKSAIQKFSSPQKDEHAGHSHSKVDNEYGVDSPLIRTGIIDVEALDKNKDGKIFECPMDWNILADEYHRCPVCEMKMVEYTLEEIKVNLNQYGYKFKE